MVLLGKLLNNNQISRVQLAYIGINNYNKVNHIK